MFDSLTTWGDVLDARPAVARRWERNHRATRWRFFLRPDAQFHDGTRVTAPHFVRTWSELARSGRAHHHLQDVAGYAEVRSGRSTALDGVTAVDELILEVRLSRPLAEFPAMVAHPALAPMPAAATVASRDLPIGNGPFRMAEPWVHGRFVRLQRTRIPPPADATGATPLHEVVFSIQDPASAYIAYEQGGVDVATVPPVALAAEDARAQQPTTRYRGPGLLRGDLPSTYFLVCNTAAPPCDSVRARRGIGLAVHRRRMVTQAFARSAAPGVGVLPAALPGHVSRTCSHCVHDPVRARALLARAGVERTRLWISKGGDHRRVAQTVQAGLSRVGVTATIKAVGFQRFLAALRRGERGLFRFGWTLDYPTGDNALRPLFHSDGALNFARYQRRDVDRLLAAGAQARTARRRIALYRAAEDRILGRDQAIIPVATLRRRTVVAERVRNLAYGPMGTANLAEVSIVERPE